MDDTQSRRGGFEERTIPGGLRGHENLSHIGTEYDWSHHIAEATFLTLMKVSKRSTKREVSAAA